MKIVSLVPSLTELLIDLGLTQNLVGRTRFCVRPENYIQNIEVIGGTKNPTIDKIKLLKPDWVLASKEENRKEDIVEIQHSSNVLITDIKSVNDALDAILYIGQIFNRTEKADSLIRSVNREKENILKLPQVRTAYYIWRDPWMSIGGDTYINDVMAMFGLVNICATESRYPILSLEKLAERNPEVVLLSSEPYPFNDDDIERIKEYCPDSLVFLIEGQWFSWYGSRMISSFKALRKWIFELYCLRK